jgi:large subunit ribosomal protein L13
MATSTKVYAVDAEGKSFGRLASEVAALLRGKSLVNFAPHENSGTVVNVKNLLKLKFTGNKLTQKKYYRHSGHPGGITERGLDTVWEKQPEKTFTRAVERMLPDNKLRKGMLKRLKITL